MVRMTTSIVAAVCAAALALGACSAPRTIGGNGSFGGEGGGGAVTGPFRVGLVGNFSGALSYVGSAIKGGVQYSSDVLNEGGGILGRKVESIECDSQFSNTTAANCITKLVSVDDVDMLLLDTPQGLDVLGNDAIAKLGVPVFVTISGDIDPAATPNVFSVGGSGTDAIQPGGDVDVLVDFLTHERGFRRPAIVASEDPISDVAVQEYTNRFDGAGARVVSTERFFLGDVDMTTQVRAAQSAGADVVMCIGLGADCARVRMAMDRIGFKAQFAGTVALYMRAFRELTKDLSNDAVFTTPHGQTNDIDPAFLQWLFGYLRRYGFKTFVIGGSVSPDYPGLELPAFQAVDIYAKAAKVANSTEPDKVLAALVRPEGYKSVGETHTWSATQHNATVDPPREPWVTRFVNGHIMWDWDKRSIPALEQARYNWEEQMFSGSYDSDVDFLLKATTVWLSELHAHEAELVAAEGQAKFDQRVAETEQVRKTAESLQSEGKATRMPTLGN